MPNLSTDRRFGVAAALAVKAPVRAAATAPVTLADLQSIDAVALASGDRVLVMGQADPKQNGVYLAGPSAWARAPDFNDNRDVVSGTRVFVAGGALNGGKEYVAAADGPVTPGLTALAFERHATVVHSEAGMTAASAVATAGQSSFALAYRSGAALFAVNGVIQDSADYVAADGATVVFAHGLNAGDVVSAHSLAPIYELQPAAFSARLASSSANATGAGLVAAVICDTEFADEGAVYDPVAGLFTAPTTGLYQFNLSVGLSGLTPAMTDIALTLTAGGLAFVARSAFADPAPAAATLRISQLAPMAAGDVASAAIVASGGAEDVASLIGGLPSETFFSGFLVR